MEILVVYFVVFKLVAGIVVAKDRKYVFRDGNKKERIRGAFKTE